jgi:hypothetical protein
LYRLHSSRNSMSLTFVSTLKTIYARGWARVYSDRSLAASTRV